MNILTDEEIEAVQEQLDAGFFGQQTGIDFARAVEAEVAKTLRKQVIEEICFKMAAGSPNRERIHKLIDGWVL